MNLSSNELGEIRNSLRNIQSGLKMVEYYNNGNADIAKTIIDMKKSSSEIINIVDKKFIKIELIYLSIYSNSFKSVS